MVTAAEFYAVDDVKRETILAENEIVTGIEASAGWKSAYYAVRERQSFDWPLVSVAVAVKGSEARIVLGAVAPQPWRGPEVSYGSRGLCARMLTGPWMRFMTLVRKL